MKTIAIISSQAFSLVNFRGPLIRELAASNIKVYALAPDYTDELRLEVKNMRAHPVDFYLTRTGMNPWRDGVDMAKLVILLRRLQPEVTLGYFIKPVIYGTLAAWLSGVPYRIAMIEGLGYIFTPPTSTVPFGRKLLRFIATSLYRLALARAHRVIFLNRDDIAEFVGRGLVHQSKAINLGGIGVDLADWPMTVPVKQPLTFLLVARLLREKGVGEYVEAARQVKALHPEVRFVLLGGLDPNPGSFSQSEVNAWVKEGWLEWPGHVDVKPWLAQASVFVLPSYREGVPRSTQEAMAMGRPVITTDVPGCRETVDEGVNGYLVPARDSSALVTAMLRFVKNPDLIVSMGKESRRIAEARFDVHQINANMMEILKLHENAKNESCHIGC